MKKLFLILSAALLAVAAVSCTKEKAEVPAAGGERIEMRFSADIPALTKASLSGLSVVWSEGDQIAVYESADYSTPTVFTLAGGAGSTKGWFSGTVNPASEVFYAVYPASAAVSFTAPTDKAEATVNVTVPAEQLIPAGAKVCPEALVAVCKADGNNLSFKNATALAKLTLSAAGADKITFSGLDAAGIAGTATVDCSTAEASTTGTASAVSLVSSAGFEAGDYYAAVLPAELKGVNIAVADGDDRGGKSSSKTALLSRSGCLDFGDVLSGLTWAGLSITNAKQLQDWALAAASYSAEDVVSLEADINMSAYSNFIPAASFAGTFDGLGHSIKNWKASSPLIVELQSSAVLSDLTIDSSCELTFPSGYEHFGFVVCRNNGMISNVVNNAPAYMYQYCYTDVATSSFYGIIVGSSLVASTLDQCVNNGDFLFSGVRDVKARTLWFGGVAGLVKSTVEDVTIASGCENHGNITFEVESDDVSTNSWHIGGVLGALQVMATASGCANTGDVTFRVPFCTGLVSVAGVVSYAAGKTENCENSGVITAAFESAESAADGYFRAAMASGITGYISQTMDNCTNNGDVILRAGYNQGSPLSLGQISGMVVSSAAGLVSYGASSSSKMNGCKNYGAVSSTLTQIENSTETTAGRHNAAGVISSATGKLTGCENHGPVTGYFASSEHNAAVSKNVVVSVGGVTGGAYQATNKNGLNLENCVNDAAVYLTLDASKSNSCLAGISAWPGSENADNKGVTKSCTNSGAITFDGYGKVRMGGITGGTGHLQDCTNTGHVYLRSGATTSSVGGLMGFLNFHSVTGCKNTGLVQSDVLIANGTKEVEGVIVNYTSQAGAGGLVGATGNTDITFTGNSVNCKIQIAGGCKAASMIIGMIDRDKKAAADQGKKFDVGTAGSPIKVKGQVNSTVLTSSNYTDYVHAYNGGYLNLNPGVVFNTVFGE